MNGDVVRAGRLIRASSIQQAWYRGLSLIFRDGHGVTDERGTEIKELLCLQVVVEDPFRDRIPVGYGWDRDRLEEYASQLLSGDNPGFEYTYGQRLRRWEIPMGESGSNLKEPVDQLDLAVRRLIACPTTRRASAVTWIPPVDSVQEEIPCMLVMDFKIRQGRLFLTALFRSHDFAGAYPANLYGLGSVLKYVAGEVGEKPGSITTLSVSAHVYQHDWDWVEELLKGVPPEI